MTHSALSRAIQLVNILVAALVLAALGLVYWYAWRPLAQYSGSVDAPVSARITVAYDKLGEPHIRAASLEDALFAQGYATAQERLFQMDGLRRLAAGELSEILGPTYLESDRDARRLRLRRIAEGAYTTLPAEDRAAFAAYARGVNHYIATHRHSLPLEFTLIGYQPRPWSVVDCLLVSLHMMRNLTTTWRDEINKQLMLQSGDRAKVDFLYPAGSGAGPQPGSNAWAVAGSRTASGKPLLSNDMHLEYSLPGVWYMAHLQAPGLDVAGVTLPGVPGVMVGHNQRIAWGITNLQFDVQDLYLEQFDEATGHYLYRGEMQQSRAERDLIQVKGRAPVEQLIWVTRHGPVYLSENGTHMALRWMAAEPGLLQYPILQINRASNWAEFTSALARYPGPGANFVYADVDGNIGFHVAGQLPRRQGCRGDVPTDGSTGACEWNGVIPFAELPSVYNPPSGIVVSANQDTFPKDYPFPVNGNFAPPGRARQIRNRLSARSGLRAPDMLSIQADVYSAIHALIARELVAAYDRRKAHNPSMDSAVTLLRRWDGRMNRDSAAALVASLANRYVRTAAAESASPTAGARYEFSMASAAVERLLLERPAGWFDDYDGMLLRALSDAVEEARRVQGPDMSRWQYGRTLRVGINNPVLHKLPVVGGYFDIAPQPMSGAASTVKQTTRTLAPSMRMTVDLGDLDRSILNIQTGQSGQALSSHYKDQWAAWYWATSFPMPFHQVKSESALEFRPSR